MKTEKTRREQIIEDVIRETSPQATEPQLLFWGALLSIAIDDPKGVEAFIEKLPTDERKNHLREQIASVRARLGKEEPDA